MSEFRFNYKKYVEYDNYVELTIVLKTVPSKLDYRTLIDIKDQLELIADTYIVDTEKSEAEE